ncbi:MAG: release factor glutamine methyltransferase [Chitinophagales bacterium]|jgi:release factor glutamine methyltransferase
MNWFFFKQQGQEALDKLYDSKEASNLLQILAEELLPHYHKINFRDRLFELNAKDLVLLEKGMGRLMTGEPLQYILGKAWFYDMELTINNSVLIPRPETEELVDWIIQDWKGKEVSMLDIGSGSGCIPFSLANNIPTAHIEAIDVSEEALQLSQLICCELMLNVQFKCVDILDEKQWSQISNFDVIVSNPPYIPLNEKEKMNDNVLAHEPHLALFVDDEDPLLFYRKIASFALKHLNPEGALYFECNEFNALDLKDLMQSLGFINIVIQKDLQGKNRMLKATLDLGN